MIPRSVQSVSAEVPVGATFWVPEEDDLGAHGEEGSFEYFEDAWFIRRVSADAAASLVVAEKRLADLVDRYSDDAAQFEVVAHAIENDDPTDLPTDLVDALDLWDEDEEFQGDDLGNLEIGVAGLVAALNASKVITAASCRGHHRPGLGVWSTHPVVYFAGNRDQVEWLAPMVAAAGCGFSLDPERPRILVVEAPSISHTMSLAQLVLR